MGLYIYFVSSLSPFFTSIRFSLFLCLFLFPLQDHDRDRDRDRDRGRDREEREPKDKERNMKGERVCKIFEVQSVRELGIIQK